ncbi:uncharacterized protein LOC142985212 [Anticarsia gemmatalis]|uniref:uncharacterized protein LOC142985212 n=1 Tax=Anticarsia gemmatalis TaxID=129554 RepID=UPI003F77371B
MCMYISACVVCGYTRGTRDIMTSRLHLLLAAACALALIQLASGQDRCEEKSIGIRSQKVHNYPPEPLRPGKGDFKLKIPPPPSSCGKVVGTRALACDYDKAPILYFEGTSTLVIKRQGELKQPGKVLATSYCS